MLDGTLRAIVAADRLPISESLEGKDLLRQRLVVFYGYFALLSVLAAAWGRTRQVPFVANLQAVHALVLCVVFLALRFRVREGWFVSALDVLATVATACTAAVGLSNVPRAATVDVSAVAFFLLFFVVRAALVPSKPWVATMMAVASAVPFTLGLAVMYQDDGATFAAARSMAAGILGVFVVSKTIYGLRTAIAEAVRLGQYVVHEKIGEGGMGSVYRASHAMLKRPTAIKVIPPDRAGETATARFEREVRAASRLMHPNNVAIYDFGRTRGGVFYYAMELLDGEDLGRLVEREGPQTPARTRAIVRQIAAALGEAHGAGLVHRDVKPANVMLCMRGGARDFVKVVDFGLVKDIASSDPNITREHAIAGTPLYMAPESIVGPPGTVGPAVDVYGVGCIAYFLLTGRPPFAADNLVAICAAHVHDEPAPPSTHAPDVSVDLDALVLRCLAKKPEMRPTAGELEAALGD